MVGIDDVAERVREGVAAHGWGPVLRAVAAMLAADADGFRGEGTGHTAAMLAGAAGCVRSAALCVGGNPPPDPPSGVMAAVDELIDKGYANTAGLITREALRYRIVGIVARHIGGTVGCEECGYPMTGGNCPVCAD
jgi:hypothetical protein